MSNQSALRQRTELPFRRAEWELLVRLPGRVVVAATSAHVDPARRTTVAEGLAGIDAIAAGRASASRAGSYRGSSGHGPTQGPTPTSSTN